ncbi:MAG: hypothetical protein ABI045_06255 [Flavobacteriales bacterium]
MTSKAPYYQSNRIHGRHWLQAQRIFYLEVGSMTQVNQVNKPTFHQTIFTLT